MSEQKQPAIVFQSLNLCPEIIAGLKKLNLKPLSDVEAKAIPALLAGKGVVVISPTGTGKTFSYLIPILNEFCLNPDQEGTRAVVIVPTAVLGFQVKTTVKSLARQCGLKNFSVSFFGSNKEIQTTRQNPALVIITPPLFNSLSKSMNMSGLQRIIFDEGDMILFDGFYDEMKEVCESYPRAKKSFFSASLGSQWYTNVKKMCQADEVFDLSNGRITGNNIKHVLVDLRGFTREQALEKVVTDPEISAGKAIVFVSKKEEVGQVSRLLDELGLEHVDITGSLDKSAIEKRIRIFRDGHVNLMVATDYASRGLDLPNVECAISYTLPKDLKYYFHRAGRTGRFNTSGKSLVLCGKDDIQTCRGLQRKGAGFVFMAVKKDGVVSVKSAPQSRLFASQDPAYMKKAVLKAKLQHPKGKVKPNYKKKIKTAAAIAKAKHKRKIIRTNLGKKDLTHGV